MRKTFFLSTKPHFAESCFFAGRASAICGLLFFRQGENRMVRFAVFVSGGETAFCGKLFFFWASFRILRFVIFLSGTKPHGAVFLLGIFKTAFCGLLQSEGFSYFGQIGI
ncbi:MAG: hypothetical protein J5798_08715 [Spirochaetaceae bacterium]|nr:hypothetical protein [Spirochaetaceae bacterium]